MAMAAAYRAPVHTCIQVEKCKSNYETTPHLLTFQSEVMLSIKVLKPCVKLRPLSFSQRVALFTGGRSTRSAVATAATAADASPTKLDYYNDMLKLQSRSTLLSYSRIEDGRSSVVLDSTVFHPQGGGQPFDTGFIAIPADPDFKFIVNDVRSKDGIVFHYGFVENSDEGSESKLKKGVEVALYVDELRRKLNSRLHSAGHLLDACMRNVGLGHLEPTKGYHFPDGPFVEYKGTIPHNEMQSKQEELELETNKLISEGGKVSVAILPYEEASNLCGGCLPDYIPKESTPRIVKLGDTPGCPCGGTHVSDISEIISVKVSQIRTKKGMTKVFYNIGS